MQTMWNDFITGFQFFTRISLVRQTEWSLESFGRSVKMLPLIGAIIGALLGGGAYLLQTYLFVPAHLLAALLVIAEIIITGGLHCDGFMDTADGVFSGRPRERMLEIMKDSRVGAFGAMAFGLLILLKYSLYLDMPPALLPLACLTMGIGGKLGLVIAVTRFSYARPEGLGKMFYSHHGRYALPLAALLALAMAAPFGGRPLLGLAAAVVSAYAAARYVSARLGGLTGDVYGAVNELAELAVLCVFVMN